jgi:DNA primase
MSLAQDIESRIQILDIVNRYVNTKKAWVNYKGLCPFHTEKTASFVISPTKNIAHCFSCGKWGGPIKFLMEVEKIDFREAVQILAKEAGIELKTDFQKEKAEKWQDIYALYRWATQWYHDALFLTENKHALDYLLNRWITLETIKKFQLGYSSSPRDLLYALKQQGFETQFMIDSGLFVSETRDKFFGRIIYPIANAMGHTVAFTGRVLGDALPKYLNSPASHIFDKSSILYWLHLAKQSIAKTGAVYIVEGQMDTIALHQAGVDNTVWISGTALTKEHVRFLRRFAKTIYLSLDSDSAWVKATFASIENLLNEDLEIRVIAIPNGKDPDEFTKNGGKYEWLIARTQESHSRMLNFEDETSLSVIEFYLKQWHLEYDLSTIVGKKKLIEKCLELIVKLKSQIEVDFYLQQISRKLEISMDILYSEYKRIRVTVGRASIPKKENTGDSTLPDTFSPSLIQLLSGYIARYKLLDLFFQEFQYTHEDLTSLEGSLLLQHSISDSLNSDDHEILSILDLYLEEVHTDSNPELVERAFRDLVRKLHAQLLDLEKQRLLQSLNSDDPEYLKVYTYLAGKAKALKLPPGSIKI